jgi:hypothetical protein
MTANSQHAPADMEDTIRGLQDQIRLLQQQVQDNQNAIGAGPPIIPNPAPVVIPAPRIKPERPPPFTGKKSESLEAWIFQMQQYCNLAQVPANDRILFAGTFFKDQAAIWWRNYHQEIDWANQAPGWEDFLTTARTHFIPVNTSINAYDRLQRLSQKTSVNAYNYEFRALMLELPDMDPATRMNYYQRGLKESIRPFVAMQQPADLAAAETIAERVDAVTFKPTTRNLGFRPNYGHRTPGGATPMELDAITKLTPSERERLRKSGGCFRCRQAGHLARDCPLPNRQHPRLDAMDQEEHTEELGKE